MVRLSVLTTCSLFILSDLFWWTELRTGALIVLNFDYFGWVFNFNSFGWILDLKQRPILHHLNSWSIPSTQIPFVSGPVKNLSFIYTLSNFWAFLYNAADVGVVKSLNCCKIEDIPRRWWFLSWLKEYARFGDLGWHTERERKSLWNLAGLPKLHKENTKSWQSVWFSLPINRSNLASWFLHIHYLLLLFLQYQVCQGVCSFWMTICWLVFITY